MYLLLNIQHPTSGVFGNSDFYAHTHTCKIRFFYDGSRFLKRNLSPRVHTAQYVIMVYIPIGNYTDEDTLSIPQQQKVR